MDDGDRWWPRLVANRSRVALVAAVVSLVLPPLFLDGGARPLVLACALLPIYLVHQYEEHARGRFVAFFNATVGKGLPVLSAVSAFWINVLLVWVLFAVSFHLARFGDLGLALIPAYAVLANALLHVGTAVALRRSNPGLATGLLLFVPAGLAVLVSLNRAIDHRPVANAVGLLAAIAGHAAVLADAAGRRARLEVAP